MNRVFKKTETWTDLIAMEHRVLDFWKEKQIFERLVEQNQEGTPWSFLDGPITANNPMGVHHAWGRTLKDCYQRFHAMHGHKQRYQNGYDCQGLWVEVEVEKEKGFKTKRDIETYGVERFVEDCKARVQKYSAIQTDQSIRLGYWMDWNNSYYTMSDENNYTIWSFLKKCHERGFIYKGHDVMPWCPRCGTGISQHEMQEGYQEREDPSIVVVFPLKDRAGENLLVWTTTPWTLSSNVGAAVHPEHDYVKIRAGEKIYYLADKLLETVVKEPHEVLERMKGKALDGLTYHGPFDELPAQAETKDLHRVVLWEDVSEEDGTGIVHIAPGCGKEDFELSKTISLPPVMPIDDAGCFLEGFGFLTGKEAGAVEADVVENLTAKGILYRAGKIEHSYPHCWRCSKPLLFRLVDEWFIAMDAWRGEIMEVVKQINWIPSYGLELELDWLKNMRDWMISKKRYWGLTLPIWVCPECDKFEVIGSKEELKERAIAGYEEFEGKSPHKPQMDGVKIACSCGCTMNRVPDVGNPWLDAGIVPYSTMFYNTDREEWKKWFPADLVLECFPGQFRNWFYALLAMSTMMENRAPFKTLLGHALVRDETGAEMHKSKGNAIWFDEAVEKMGADVMRWIYCSQDTVKNLNFGYTVGREVRGRFINTLWNTYCFFVNYAAVSGYDPTTAAVPVADRSDLDRWILSRFQSLVKRADDRYRQFDVRDVCRSVEAFVESLSNWYVRRSRKRFWRGVEDQDGRAAHDTLYEVLSGLIRIIAPVVPFLTEEIYANLRKDTDPDSIHLSRFPVADESLIDVDLEAAMDAVARINSMALSARKQADLRVRQPLAELVVFPADPVEAAACERFRGILLEEINVKTVTVNAPDAELPVDFTVKANFKSLGPKLGKQMKEAAEVINRYGIDEVKRLQAGEALVLEGFDITVTAEDLVINATPRSDLSLVEDENTRVAVVTTLDEALSREGLMRDLLRRLQMLRKESGLEIEDRIHVYLQTEVELLAGVVTEWNNFLRDELLVTDWTAESAEGMLDLDVQGHAFKVVLKKN